MNIRRAATIGAIYAFTAVVLDLVCGHFTSMPGLPYLYLPAGLYMAAVLLLGWRALPLAFLSPMFSFMASMHRHAVPTSTAVAISLLSVLSPAAVLAAMRYCIPGDARRRTELHAAATFVLTVLAAVAVESLATGVAYVAGGVPDRGTFWAYVSGRWVAFALPGLVLGSVIACFFKMARKINEMDTLIVTAPVSIALVRSGAVAKVNHLFCQLVGYRPDELVGASSRLLYDNDSEYDRVWQELFEPLAKTSHTDIETRWRRKDGTTVDVWVNAAPMCMGDPAEGVALACFDISARRRIEDHLRRGQKLEAIGSLAGGIAHDFNNILAGMFGFVELAKMDSKNQKEQSHDLDQIQLGLNRARDLVNQILVFSHGHAEGRQAVKISPVVEEALKLLRSTIPVSIEFRQNIASRAMVAADPAQIHQVVVNLCTNAYHAMSEKGGVLDISLADVELMETPEAGGEPRPIKYVQLEVADTGAGMDDKVKAQIFDPCFTTKEMGLGSGLGLAMVQSIVKSLRGTIKVASTPGSGSSFRVCLPVADEPKEPAATPDADVAKFGGNEHILFVDDEEAIVQIASRILPRYGYRVTVCRTGMKALQTFAQNPRQFDLLFTDMTMPQMNGLELVKHVRATQPTIPIIICSGYNEKINRETAAAQGYTYVQKPVRISAILEHIRQTLDRAGA